MSTQHSATRRDDNARDAVGNSRVFVAACASLLIATAVTLVYARGVAAPFLFDDMPTVVKNSSITTLSPLYGDRDGAGPLRPPRDVSTSGRPLVNLSFALNYHFCGFDTRGYHVVNMVVHVLSALVLFGLVRRTLELPYFGGRFENAAAALASATALLWAVHPLEVDAVEYITQRTELLVGFFYLSTLYAALRYLQTKQGSRPRLAWLAAAAVACLCGMASKEVMVTAPVVVLLFDRTFVSGSFGAALRRSPALYSGLCATWLLLLALNVTNPRSQSAGFHLELSPTAWWATQCQVLFLYLKLMAWPYPLLIHYELPYLDTFASAAPWVLGVALLLLGTLVLLARRTAAGFVAAAALLILSPTLVVPIITEVMAERRMYLPSAALIAFVAAGVYALAKRLTAHATPVTPRGEKPVPPAFYVMVVALVIAFLLGLVSGRRVELFATPFGVWHDAALYQPANARVQSSLGEELLHQGRYAEAQHYLENALRIDPRSGEAENDLGIALFEQGQWDAGIAHFERSVALRALPQRYFNLARAYSRAGRIDEARQAADRALTLAREARDAALMSKIEEWSSNNPQAPAAP